MVPEESIVPQGNRQFVIKVVAPGAVPDAGKLPPDTQWVSLRQEVKLGVRRQGKVEITEGVTAADTVVVAGQQRLQRMAHHFASWKWVKPVVASRVGLHQISLVQKRCQWV